MGAHDDHAEPRSRLERVVGTCVLAPVGVALHAGSALPSLVRRTRGQLATAKVVGQFAVQRGAAVAEGVFAQAQEQAVNLLVRDGAPTPSGGRAGGVEARSDLDDDRPASSGHAPSDADVDPPARGAAPGDEGLTPPPDPSSLAIPDYDSLSASQVVPRLESLTRAELEAVRAYESRTRARRTILAKVAQLESS